MIQELALILWLNNLKEIKAAQDRLGIYILNIDIMNKRPIKIKSDNNSEHIVDIFLDKESDIDNNRFYRHRDFISPEDSKTLP